MSKQIIVNDLLRYGYEEIVFREEQEGAALVGGFWVAVDKSRKDIDYHLGCIHPDGSCTTISIEHSAYESLKKSWKELWNHA